MKTRSGTKRPVPDWTWDLSYIYQHQLKEAGLVHGPGKGLSDWTFFLKDAPNRKLDDFSGLEHALLEAGWLKEQTEEGEPKLLSNEVLEEFLEDMREEMEEEEEEPAMVLTASI